MAKFKPKWVVCNLKSDSYKYSCKAIQKNELGEYSNSYYFTGKPLTHLIRNKADYDELVSLDIFSDYEPSGEKEESAKSETTKQRTLRKEAEAKEAVAASKEISIENQDLSKPKLQPGKSIEGGNKMSDEENAQATETIGEESKTEESTDVAKEDESEEDSEDDSDAEEEKSGESD